MKNSADAIQTDYLQRTRIELIALLDSIPERILEIGCGDGATLAALKQKGARWVEGVDIDENAISIAAQNALIDKTHHADFEAAPLRMSPSSYDLVIASHVIEHFVDPWKSLISLIDLVRPSGQLLIAFPNVRNIRVTGPLLLRGEWKYTPTGSLDWTHLRFFTLSSMKSTFQWAGIKITRTGGEYWGRQAKYTSLATLGVLDEFCAYAYNFLIEKPIDWRPPTHYPFGPQLCGN